jgi:hypothetical protein
LENSSYGALLDVKKRVNAFLENSLDRKRKQWSSFTSPKDWYYLQVLVFGVSLHKIFKSTLV